jgi:hypothetical protein
VNKEKDFTTLELELMENMTSLHKALMPKLTDKERQSMAENVKPEYVDLIQSWIGTDGEIEKLLFWGKGGKFDDPEWQNLKPVDEKTAQLFNKAHKRFRELKKEAIEIQRRSDLALYSQFNTKLLFTGITGAFRCNNLGKVDDKGYFFEGVELRCIGSVGEDPNCVTVVPVRSSEYEVYLGRRTEHGIVGTWIYTGDSYSLLQLDKLIRDYVTYGFDVKLRSPTGLDVLLDPKGIRRASKRGESTGYYKELILYASIRLQDMEKALESAEYLSHRLYYRFGLEIECYKIGKKYGNLFIVRNDNFDDFLSGSPVTNKGLVFLTATFECRRCKRELEAFQMMAKSYPDITFALVNIATPQFKFYERVFGDMGGGDPDKFRYSAVGSTPFIIIYKPDQNGILQFAEYYGTEKQEAPPSFEECVYLIQKHFF